MTPKCQVWFYLPRATLFFAFKKKSPVALPSDSVQLVKNSRNVKVSSIPQVQQLGDGWIYRGMHRALQLAWGEMEKMQKGTAVMKEGSGIEKKKDGG